MNLVKLQNTELLHRNLLQSYTKDERSEREIKETIRFTIRSKRKKFLGLNLPSVQFSRSVMSNSLWPHGLQHARPPCPSPTPGVHPNPCPSSRWCYQTISSSVVPFSSHLQSFPASGSFQMSKFFTAKWPKYWSFSFSISPSEHSGLISFRMDWLDLLAVQGTLKSLLQHHSSKASILYSPTLPSIQWKNPQWYL